MIESTSRGDGDLVGSEETIAKVTTDEEAIGDMSGGALKAAADQGDTAAKRELCKRQKRRQDDRTVAPIYERGKDYRYGRDTTKRDFAKALACFEEAAGSGHPGARYELGYCYHYGMGVEKDLSKAVEWYLRAAERKHEGAENKLRGLGMLPGETAQSVLEREQEDDPDAGGQTKG
jgi:TPR repeat protein